MPILKGNLHAHTTFSDGTRTASAVIDEYEQRGYDFLAITDHEELIPKTYWESLQNLRSGLLLFHGVELNADVAKAHLAPGEGFRYSSGAVIATPVGVMQGEYHMQTDDGARFDAPIPPFRLAMPGVLQ